MANQTSDRDLTELLEYDEFEAYNAFQIPDSLHKSMTAGTSNGISLREELSKCQFDVPIKNFTKAAELFLRLDIANGRIDHGAINTDNSDNESPDILDGAKDLLYENEFCNELNTNVDCLPVNGTENFQFNDSNARSFHSVVDNDDEQLLFEVLCGNRVSQMTRTYNDIEAVTRLLEEKEKDLELTVQIGKELLAQNTRLEGRVTELETEVKTANENLAQLSYDLHTKSTLLAALTNDEDGSSSEAGTPGLPKNINLDLLQRKISQLEDENKSLRAEATQLVQETDEVEAAERRLMEDITNQLNSANYQYDGINLELERQKEENKYQHEQIINLSTKLSVAEIRLHQLTSENEEQTSRLSITEENQNLLAAELAEFKARYQEVLSLLQEAQEQLRRMRKRNQPSTRGAIIPGLGVGITGQVDSLQAELMESSLFSDNSLDSGIASDRGAMGGSNLTGPVAAYKKVFETVRCAAKTGQFADGQQSQLGGMSMSSLSHPRMSVYAYPSAQGQGHRGSASIYTNSTYPSYDCSMSNKYYSRESLLSDSDDGYPGKPAAGIPGAPGAKDLEAALKRLTPAEVLARRSMLSHAPPGTYTYDDAPSGMPLGIRTPDSIMSTGSSTLSGIFSSHWRLPEKLQIIKPLEGSQTLHHWNRLATPTLGGLLDERPGITIRGGRGLDDLGLHMYSLSDVEEDADDMPGKQCQWSNSVYTYTNSTVMHPDDGMSFTSSMPPSQMSSRITSVCSSRQPSAPSTPRHGLSRRNSCSTFSVNLGLASMLNERGIKAVTPSALNTPAGPNYSPTVTPCNSPDGSPTRDRSPDPPLLLAGLFTSGADLLRRKLVGETERQSRLTARNKILLSRQEKRALRSLRLMEKVESIGLENIMPTIGLHPSVGVSPLAIQSSSAALTGVRPRTASPMAQLTSLKKIQKPLDQRTDSGIDTDSGDLHNKTNALTQQADSSTVRIKQMQRQRSRRQLQNGANGQRSDLGTVGGSGGTTSVRKGRVRPDLGRVSGTRHQRSVDHSAMGSDDCEEIMITTRHPPTNSPIVTTASQSITQSFVGTISSLFFGRKGGLL